MLLIPQKDGVFMGGATGIPFPFVKLDGNLNKALGKGITEYVAPPLVASGD